MAFRAKSTESEQKANRRILARNRGVRPAGAVSVAPGRIDSMLRGESSAVRIRSSRKLWRRLVSAACVGLVVSGSGGCMVLSGLQSTLTNHEGCNEFIIGFRNQAMAAKAWHRQKSQLPIPRHREEFKEGFIDGYLDVASGGRGCLPAIAPSKFWGWKYQSPDGQAAVNAWYQGFPYGARAAEQDGLGIWNSIQVTGLEPGALSGRETSNEPADVEALPAAEGEQIVPGSIIEIESGPAAEGSGDGGDGGTGTLPPPAGGPEIDTPAADQSAASDDTDSLIDDFLGPREASLAEEPGQATGELPFRFE